PGQSDQGQDDYAAQEEVVAGADAVPRPRTQWTQQVQEWSRGRRILRGLPCVGCQFHVGEGVSRCALPSAIISLNPLFRAGLLADALWSPGKLLKSWSTSLRSLTGASKQAVRSVAQASWARLDRKHRWCIVVP